MGQSLLFHDLTQGTRVPDQVEEFWAEFTPCLKQLFIASYAFDG
jgi:hypothetical protein